MISSPRPYLIQHTSDNRQRCSIINESKVLLYIKKSRFSRIWLYLLFETGIRMNEISEFLNKLTV